MTNAGVPATPAAPATSPETSPGTSGNYSASRIESWQRADADYAAAREDVAGTRAALAADKAHRSEAEAILRDKFGNDYVPAARLIQQHVANLPAAERTELLQAELDGSGVLALNDPETLLELLEETVGPMPTEPDAIKAEIEKAEDRMKTDRKAWIRDEAAGFRLRALYRLRDGAA